MSLRRASIDNAVQHLVAGGLVCFPTETLWSLSCRPELPEAVARLRAVKNRPEGVPLAVGVADWAAAEAIVHMTPGAQALAKRFLPGPLTIILAAKEGPCAHLNPGVSTLGIRVPDDPIARDLLALTGPLVMTSANKHGEPDPKTFDDLRRAVRTDERILAIANGPVRGTGSTVVDATGPQPRVLREGVISFEEVNDSWP